MIRLSLFLGLLSSLAFSFEVTKNTTFTKNIVPDTMRNTFSLSIRQSDKKFISKLFDQAIQVSKNAKICTNGSYSIYPNYTYSKNNNKNQQMFNGYDGRISFNCTFNDTKQLDKLIEKIDTISSKKDTLKLNINPIMWTLKPSTKKAAKDELELMALKYIYAYESYLSKVYNKQCSTTKVELANNNNIIKTANNFQTKSMSAPIKSDIIIRYNASYIFECK